MDRRLTETEWKARLTSEQYRVLREAGTERPWSSPLNDEKREGEFVCAGCGAVLYGSADKFDSGCGWPSFTRAEGDIVERPDHSHGMVRTELLCGRCGGHLGHVFDDGPLPTGQRHCINGVSLAFVPEKTE
ncbi:peptide-methionine (R)-S-oxide reductase MsrB [Sphingosinicella xenopeptidilytica]|uniref:peptide-methionine (R)-S-oxide reductase n=1 Tax=Sphingosinicella xenopeptidilytica TaxID=364098 RepID=A0ABW3C4F1_SPHXN